MSTRPAIWQLVREAAEQHFNREVSYSEIKQFVWTNYPDVNSSTLTCQIIVCVLSIIRHASITPKTRSRDLYNTGRGRVTLYVPERHGVWEIAETADAGLVVRLAHEAVDETGSVETATDNQSGIFALESHLRDYLARNLTSIANFGVPLSVFKSDDGRRLCLLLVRYNVSVAQQFEL